MRAYPLPKGGAGIDALVKVERPDPKPAYRQVMVKVKDGMLAEYAVFEENGVVKIPAHLSLEEGATLPCAGVTVWNAMTEHAKLIAGQTVLLQGTGGVSIFGLQLARMMGIQVIITSSSDEKLARAKALGANHG